MRWPRVLPIFSIAFCVLYLLAMYFNWPVFTYAPRLREFFPLRFALAAKQGPGMYYYGWLVTAGVGAAAIGIAVAYVEEKSGRRVPASLTWIVPPVVALVLIYILRGWFTH
jgi:hypothetical protein